ncbi:hypothetical protein ACFQ0T_36970 [Kitasatospora gansuensis]
MFVHHQLLEDLVRQVQAIDEAAAGADATAAHGSIGLPLTRFALGRQAETGTADESAAGIELGPLAGRTSSDVLGPEEAADGADEEKVHDLRRRLAVRFGRTSAALPLVPRLLTIRLLLEFKARGSWPAGDRSWYGLLTGAVQPLGALDPDRLADDEAEAAASLAAVVLAVLDFQATDGADRTRYEQLAESLGPLLLPPSPTGSPATSRRNWPERSGSWWTWTTCWNSPTASCGIPSPGPSTSSTPSPTRPRGSTPHACCPSTATGAT